MLFESSRVRLRKMTMEDTVYYNKWRNDLEVMYSTNPSLDIYPIDATREFVEHVILGPPTTKSYLMIEKENESPIGILTLTNIDYKNRNAECIIEIGERDYWGKGYGSEGLSLLLDYGFYEMNLHRISLRVFAFNNRAIRLYTKTGFQIEGTSRQSLFRNGQWHDVVHMGLLQKEYFRIREIIYSDEDSEGTTH
ncbi:GNAT family N-acetyltransferase [Amphibacillus sp. MSJ-3]|uniref:GNAT family N-acetyltransferase n=1 Tax=Amphibacillus sp. MSJ-3 TaxID=2841505 RepID=UPI001C0EBC05|nr:GNAT family protein [Amphibacillus sp. MSJ-3]MBU5594194.1 GNAT family N-acetyltransferase [Amphibacillus sp. MSJ-3]